jgi:hypothetical protein
VSSSWSLECSRLAFLESISGLSLDLSPEQMRLIYASLPKDRARTELRIRLALGAAIPRSVELFVFPDALIAQVPQVASFRYIASLCRAMS